MADGDIAYVLREMLRAITVREPVGRRRGHSVSARLQLIVNPFEEAVSSSPSDRAGAAVAGPPIETRNGSAPIHASSRSKRAAMPIASVH